MRPPSPIHPHPPRLPSLRLLPSRHPHWSPHQLPHQNLTQLPPPHPHPPPHPLPQPHPFLQTPPWSKKNQPGTILTMVQTAVAHGGIWVLTTVPGNRV